MNRHIIFAAVILAGLCGCEKYPAAINKKDVAVYVNKEPILVDDIKREMAVRAKQDPAFRATPDTEAEQMDIIINRRLLVQDAIKNGLSKKDDFINTTKNFWEQTLIKDYIEFKKSGFKQNLAVTEDDIKKYYENMGEKVTFKVVRAKNKRYIDELYDELKKNPNTDIVPWQTAGPAGYGNLGLLSLIDAFPMAAGEVKRFEEDQYYYIIMVAAREKQELVPLESIKADAEKRIREIKEKRLFEEWIKEERKKADIKIMPR